jgi:hypothetical protein
MDDSRKTMFIFLVTVDDEQQACCEREQTSLQHIYEDWNLEHREN